MPSDPFEAELLMMAEAVASGAKNSDSESDASDGEDDACKSSSGSWPFFQIDISIDTAVNLLSIHLNIIITF